MRKGVVMTVPDRLPVCRKRAEEGQSTVEYALVVVVFLSMAIALGALWRAGRDGALLNRAVEATSHQMGGSDALGSLRDITLF